ncbi:Cytochrome P450 [Corchorus capsularis]|uniref:Cytochrome P450 n=1 Tax=Corchorus capsularis TaxID=210143 RepID=A0A1R3GLW7_COCAP|nr:Cytochrome P450 [Corchorus capsularis]
MGYDRRTRSAAETAVTVGYGFGERLTVAGSDIAFAPYGGYWRQLRKICALELFSAKRVQSFRSVREEEVSNLIALISSNKGLPINLGEMLNNLTYSITLRSAFSGRRKQHEAFLSFLKKTLEELGLFSGVVDLFPSMKLLYWMSGTRKRHQRLHHDLDEMFERIIEEHRANKANPKNGDEVTDDLIDVLLKLQDRGDLEFPLTTDNIKAVILDILATGTDTSSTTIVWAMAEMMKNPRVMEKAQAEVRQIFDRTGEVNESNIHKSKYLNLVIKETLRLHPPVPLIPRENVERCEIKGYEIPAKSKVLVNIWAIGREPNYWNEAERFNPERFLDSSIDYRGLNFEYIPFGGGRRICPGISFGMAVVELCLANLLYLFDWKLPNGMKHEDLDMTEAFSATGKRKTDLCLIPIPYDAPCVEK